ncbi:hypothetical protein U1Q18_023930 [Sarracenia purpurea var. burkii]
MIGTLTPHARPPLRFSPANRIYLASATASNAKMYFAGRNPIKAAVHAVTETAPAVETRKAGSLYEILRVKRNASSMEIKAAYWSLAKLYHPDSPCSESSDGRDFIEIHNAYATLSDPTARALYDLSLGAGSDRRAFGYAAGNRSGFYTTRRWETDQCW